jgi:hypothetical protein
VQKKWSSIAGGAPLLAVLPEVGTFDPVKLRTGADLGLAMKRLSPEGTKEKEKKEKLDGSCAKNLAFESPTASSDLYAV